MAPRDRVAPVKAKALDEAARILRALLAKIEGGELAASAFVRARLEGAVLAPDEAQTALATLEIVEPAEYDAIGSTQGGHAG